MLAMMNAPPIVAAVTKRLAKTASTISTSSFSDEFVVRPIQSVVTFRRQPMSTTSSSSSSSVQTLLRDLRQLDTSSLCDAEKTVANSSDEGGRDDGGVGSGIKLMNGTIRPMNYHHYNRHPGPVGGVNVDLNANANAIMAGVARTVSFTEPNDFLPVMRALALEAEMDEVLVVDTMSSTRAVAGEIFVKEARRKGLAGIIIDGPIRDTAHLDDCDDHTAANPVSATSRSDDDGGGATPIMRMYATSVTPYSGTTQSPGETQAAVVTCGGIEVRPGDIVVGDNDGVLVGDADIFSKLVPIAQQIQHIESELITGITSSSLSSRSSEKRTLASMTNLDKHVQRRLEGQPSNLEFRI